jgi:hypothetical protein
VFVHVYQPIIHIAWTYLLIHWKKRFQSAGKMDTLEKWLGALLGRSISSNSTTPKGFGEPALNIQLRKFSGAGTQNSGRQSPDCANTGRDASEA